MPRARKHLVCVSHTPYYHVSSRCVRRAFLCGQDSATGKSYEHRRGWIEDRLRVLASLFSIELCAYAIMSNHYHLVVKLNPIGTDAWSDSEVLDRWTALFRGPLLVQRHLSGEALSSAEQSTLDEIITVYRNRLGSLSWFMKCLNEPISRKANAEDRCTGHFWEARFHSQPLCSEQALFAAMAYVDLNPIRATIANTPESSDYTSIKARLDQRDDALVVAEAVGRLLERSELYHLNSPARPLLGFTGEGEPNDAGLPMRQTDYLALVDTTGRQIVHGKRGRIDSALPPILERLGLSPDQWIGASTAFKQHYRRGELATKQSA